MVILRSGLAAAAFLLFAVLATAPAAAQESAAGMAVAARDLPRGAVLDRDDVDFRDPATEPDAAPVGWVTRRVVSRGESLRPPAVAPLDLIRVGDPVQVVWSQDGVEVRLNGRAMGSATAGERVLVRVDARRRFEGIAVGAGTVRLEPSDERRTR